MRRAAKSLGCAPRRRAESFLEIEQGHLGPDDQECDHGGQDTDDGRRYPPLETVPIVREGSSE